MSCFAGCNEMSYHLLFTLEEWLRGTDVTWIEIPTPQANPGAERNPWLDTAGLFADDSTLEPMLQEIYAERAAERPMQ